MMIIDLASDTSGTKGVIDDKKRVSFIIVSPPSSHQIPEIYSTSSIQSSGGIRPLGRLRLFLLQIAQVNLDERKEPLSLYL